MVKCNLQLYIQRATHYAQLHTEDLSSPDTLSQELNMWHQWNQEREKEGGQVASTLGEALVLAQSNVLLPNVQYLLKVLLTMPVTSASTERANSTLKFIKTKLRSKMSQTALNAFVLAYKHKDILHKITAEELVDSFIRMKRRRLLMVNPISD